MKRDFEDRLVSELSVSELKTILNDTFKELTEISKERESIMTLDEACEYLGYKKSYVWKLTSAGIIPHSKPNGKKLFFDREKLEEWMLSKEKKSRNERQIEAATYLNTKGKK